MQLKFYKYIPNKMEHTQTTTYNNIEVTYTIVKPKKNGLN